MSLCVRTILLGRGKLRVAVHHKFVSCYRFLSDSWRAEVVENLRWDCAAVVADFSFSDTYPWFSIVLNKIGFVLDVVHRDCRVLQSFSLRVVEQEFISTSCLCRLILIDYFQMKPIRSNLLVLVQFCLLRSFLSPYCVCHQPAVMSEARKILRNIFVQNVSL